MILFGVFLLHFVSAIGAVPIYNENSFIEGNRLLGVPLTAFETEMLERKNWCRDCPPIGFVFITGSLKIGRNSSVNVSDFIPSTENPIPTDENVLNSIPEDILGPSVVEALPSSEGYRSKRLVGEKANSCCGNRIQQDFISLRTEDKLVKNGLEMEKGQCCDKLDDEIKLHSCCQNITGGESANLQQRNLQANSVQNKVDKPGLKENKSNLNCTFFNNLKYISGLDFPGEPFAVICIDDYDRLGYCGPTEEVMFDCSSIPTKDGKHSCCLEKFFNKYLPSFDKIYDTVAKAAPDAQRDAYIPLYPKIGSSYQN